ERGFFQEPIIKDITAYLQVISNPLENNIQIVRILNRPNYGIKQIEICKFNNYANKNKLTLYEAFDQISKIEVNKTKFLEAKKTLTNVIDSKKRLTTLDLIHSLLFEQEFYKYEIALENNRNIELINQFYEFAEEYNSIYPDKDIEDFTEYLSFASNFEIEEQNLEEQSVVISTIHGVKGMQYPVVIIPDLVENKLPTRHQKDKFAIPKELLKGVQSEFDEKELHTQEERRLFYVAITRAKEKLLITYAKRYADNKTDSKISRFLTEIDYQKNPNITFQQKDAVDLSPESTSKEDQIQTQLIKQILSNLRIGQFSEALQNVLLFAKSKNKTLDIKTELIAKLKEPDYTLLDKTEEEPVTVPENHVFSVSQFVSYKKCPKLYQFRHVMKIPEKPKYYFDFGSSLHNIAEQLTRMQKDGKPINQTIAFELLAKFWDPKGYKSEIDEKRDYEDAKNILRVFLDEQAKSKTQILDIERWFETSIGEVKLRGRIDRIDKEGPNYTVVDYKTSKKASSLNELKKDMQLLVYALAVRDIYGNGSKLKVGDWFLRSNEKVFFEPEQNAIETMQAEITQMAAKIKAGSFEAKKGSWECTQCDYKCLCD
ncbi:MAG: Dna2/Cas4 domain-containing protein, partial [Crenarchaeota archaeon]|nr:Dna2/Cas4 domain-containing protein [Thermoproteota archaeon]